MELKKFVVERILPGAGNLTPEELQSIAQKFCEAISLIGKPHHWMQCFVTEDKIYCIHIAEQESVIREHSKLIQFPIHKITQIIKIIDPQTSNPLR